MDKQIKRLKRNVAKAKLKLKLGKIAAEKSIRPSKKIVG